MTIEEILRAAGIEDEGIIAKVKEEMPKAYMPLADANKRIAAAKTSADDAAKALEEAKAAQAKADEEAKAAAEGKDGELSKLQQQYADLQKRFDDAQEQAKQTRGREALVKALTAGGANPAAVELLASSALGRVEYGEDGKPSNAQAVADALKESNAGLFGAKVDTGEPPKKGDGDDNADRFLRGFGAL